MTPYKETGQLPLDRRSQDQPSTTTVCEILSRSKKKFKRRSNGERIPITAPSQGEDIVMADLPSQQTTRPSPF